MIFIILFLLFVASAFYLGSKTTDEGDFSNFSMFALALVVSLVLSTFGSFFMNINIFFGNSFIDLITNSNQDSQISKEMERLLPNNDLATKMYIESIASLIVFASTFFISYIIIYTIRIIKFVKNKKENIVYNLKSGFAFGLEAIFLFSIVVMPLSMMANYYYLTERALTNKDTHICEVFSIYEENKLACNAVDILGKDIFLKRNSNIFYNQILFDLYTDSSHSKTVKGLEKLDDQVNIFFDSNAYKIVTDRNFSVSDMDSLNIDFQMLMESSRNDSDEVADYTLLYMMDIFNIVLENFYKNNRDIYPSLNFQDIKYDLPTFKQDFAKINQIGNFINETNLIGMMDFLDDGVSFSSVMDILDFMLENNLLRPRLFKAISDDIGEINFVKIMADHIEVKGFFDRFLNLVSSPTVVAMYVSSGLIEAFDMFLEEFRNMETYETMRNAVLNLKSIKGK